MASSVVETASVPGVIEAGAVYTRDEFLKRTRFGRAAYLSALHNGLQVVKRGNRSFIRGEDFLQFIAPKSVE